MKKLRQIWNDHKAMQIFRKHRGDLKLVDFVGGESGSGYECYIFQHKWCELDADPAIAILKAFNTWKREDTGWPGDL